MVFVRCRFYSPISIAACQRPLELPRRYVGVIRGLSDRLCLWGWANPRL